MPRKAASAKEKPESKAEQAKDKKMGIKEGSPKDEKMDAAAMKKKKKSKPKTTSTKPAAAKMMGRGIGIY